MSRSLGVRRFACGCCLLLGILLMSAAHRASAQTIQLGDVTAGGDGTGTAPAENVGVDPRNGMFATEPINGHITEADPEADGLDPSPVDESDFIDSVFILEPPEDLGEIIVQGITQSGIEFEFPAADGFGSLWNHILRDSAGGAWAGGNPFLTGGIEHTSGVGLHAAGGITYDLNALRAAHGIEGGSCFSTVWGMDACGGDVNLYVVVSSEADGVIESFSGNFTQNGGEFLQVDLPAGAEYLTLATGSNGGDGCDHGTFAIAQIDPGVCEAPEPVELRIVPDTIDLAPGAFTQISVLRIDNLGLSTDVTAGAEGTTYSADPAGIVDVSADGLVTATGAGEATLTAQNGALSAEAAVTVAGKGYIDLGDIVAGGTGIGNAPVENIGIEADLGMFVQARFNADVNDTNFVNPEPVPDSPLIDSVFVMDVAVGQVISTEEIVFDFADGDAAQGWEAILKGREPGGPDSLSFGVAGPFDEGIGLHAAQGITFDLDEMRAEHGEDAVKFVSAIAGEASGQPNGLVNSYVILADADGVIDSRAVLGATDSGALVQMEIPPTAVFLTFAVGAAGNGIGSDHGAFGLARITEEGIDTTNVGELIVAPSSVTLDIGGEQAVSVSGTLAGPDPFTGLPIVVDIADVTFTPEDATVAVVEDGVIKGLKGGQTTITASLGDIEAEISVTVGRLLHLGDITAGGDGTGTAPAENIGIDPRNGLFALTPIGGHIFEADFEGDGLDPSPVDETDFVDSVFILGERDLPPGEILPQLLTQSGIEYEFPSEDGFGSLWNHILRDSAGGVWADGAGFLTGGQTHTSGVGLHSAGGITYDLSAIRAEHGNDAAGTFSTMWGMDGCNGDVNLYVITSSDAEGVIEALTTNATSNFGETITVDISSAQYLTLATGSNGGDGCDHGTFASAFILGGGEPPPPPDQIRRGDVNNDGAVNIADMIYMLNGLFGDGSPPTCAEAGDLNGDNSYNIADAIYGLNRLFGDGPPAIDGAGEDGWQCGADPNPAGSLGCDLYDKCP